MSLHPTLPAPLPTAVPRYILQRGCALAESRLSYLAELFHSGRWRRYYSEIAFLDDIQEAKEAVERWRAMLDDEAAAPPLMPWQASRLAEPAPVYQGSVLFVTPRPPKDPVQAAAAPPAKPDWQHALDPQALSERYPMLRAAM